MPVLFGANVHKPNLKKSQIFQNKTSRIIANALWFVRNLNIHKHLETLETPLKISQQVQCT